MQIVIEGVRKIVVLILLMELVLQLQTGKQYEAYIKLLVGIMVVFCMAQGVFGSFGHFEEWFMEPMQDFKWSGEWYAELEEQAQKQADEARTQKDINVEEIKIDEIAIDRREIHIEIFPK